MASHKSGYFITKGMAWPWDALLTVPEGWVRLDKTIHHTHHSIVIYATEDHSAPPKVVDATLRSVRDNENDEKWKLFPDCGPYKLEYADQAGYVWVCSEHDQNSKHHVSRAESTHPCLHRDPYKETDVRD